MTNFTITCNDCGSTDVHIEGLVNQDTCEAILVCNEKKCTNKFSTLDPDSDDDDKAIMLEQTYETEEMVRKAVNKRLTGICQNHLRNMSYSDASELDTMRFEVIAYVNQVNDWRVILIEHRVRQYESLFAEPDGIISVSLDDHFGLATIQEIKDTYNDNLTLFENTSDAKIAKALILY